MYAKTQTFFDKKKDYMFVLNRFGSMKEKKKTGDGLYISIIKHTLFKVDANKRPHSCLEKVYLFEQNHSEVF